MSLLLHSLHAEKSARTRTDTTRMPGASRGTDGSKPVPSTGESRANLTSSIFDDLVCEPDWRSTLCA
jgi:hypothetical protein